MTCYTLGAIEGSFVQQIGIHTLMQAVDRGGQAAAGLAEDRQKAVKILFLIPASDPP